MHPPVRGRNLETTREPRERNCSRGFCYAWSVMSIGSTNRWRPNLCDVQKVALTGTGTYVQLAPTSVDFGSRPADQSGNHVLLVNGEKSPYHSLTRCGPKDPCLGVLSVNACLRQ
jgi:hypothetical protein